MDERALQSQLAQSHQRLDALVRDLHGVDDEFATIESERAQHDAVQEVFRAFEKLETAGASELFWGGPAELTAGEERIRSVRARMSAFEKRVGEIEGRRLEVLEAIDQAQQDADWIEDDLLEIKREEDLRKHEWIVERDESEPTASPVLMPWSRGGEDDIRFRKSLAIALALSLLIGLIVPMIDLPVSDRWEPIEVPDRLTRLLQEPPPPPPPVREETQVAEKLVDTAKETPKPSDEPKKTTKPTKDAKSMGILAFREKFSSLAEGTPNARLGAQARIRDAGRTKSGATRRALVASQVPTASGGINVSNLSRDIGSGGDAEFEGVAVTQATSNISAVGGGSDRPLSGGPGLARTDEEIQIVFDRHKAKLYRLYNRELRKNPTLQGQMVLRITIEPDGSVSLCAVQSTDMKAPGLAANVVQRVSKFDFGAKDGISTITILYPIDFLPAT